MVRSSSMRGSTSTSQPRPSPSHLARQRDSRLRPGSGRSRPDARPSPHRHHRPSTLRSMDRRDRLIEAGMILASELSLEAVLQRIIELAVEITDAQYGAMGVIYLTEKKGAPEFAERDERDVLVLAAQAGIAIENARLYQEVNRLAVLEDRERIAKEL